MTHERASIARKLRDDGMSLRTIAGHLRVSQATVARLPVLVS
ncbi:helix-turn-helix domain-containing protein [Terracoccus luteus]